ncbi:MAG: hypothetical protein DMH00_10595, partial [Acidobacteria bacterium]
MISIRPEASREGTQGGFKAALPLMLGRVVGFAATFFIPVILARIFEPAQFGTYRQLFLIYGTLYGVAQLGMAESLLYFLPMARRHPGRYVTNATLVIGVTGLVCLLCLQEARGTISRWLSNDALGNPLPLLGLFLLFMTFSAPLEILLIAQGRYGWAAVSYALSDILRAVLILLPALLLHSLAGLLLGAAVVAAARAVALLLYLRREFPGDVRPDRALLKSQLAYALPFQLVVILEALQTNF